MDPTALRAVERILAVAIGGMSILLGYRLFLALPQQRDSSGTVRLPWNISIALARVGPGVFFALFGAAVVGLSLHDAVRIEQKAPAGGGTLASRDYLGVGPNDATGGARSIEVRRLETRMQIEALNGLTTLLRPDASADQKQTAAHAITAAKLALMEPLWGADWGDREAFRDWAEGDVGDPVPAGLDRAAAFFRAPQGGGK